MLTHSNLGNEGLLQEMETGRKILLEWCSQ